jgi:serine/threonine protein kinase
LAATKVVCEGILDGVEFIHSKGLAHRDLHVNNVIIVNGVPKIIDLDYSSERSLGKLNSLQRTDQLQEDIDQAGFIILRILKQCGEIDLDVLMDSEASLRRATSLDAIRNVLSQIWSAASSTTSPMSSGIRSENADVDLSQQTTELIEKGRRVSLRQLVIGKAVALAAEFSSDYFDPQKRFDGDDLQSRVARYEELTLPFAAVVANGCFWDDVAEAKLWSEAVSIVANANADRGPQGGTTAYLKLQLYPAGILLYAAGLGAVANEHYSFLREFFDRCHFYEHGSEPKSLTSEFWQIKAEDRDFWNKHILKKDFYTPISDHLNEILRSPLGLLAPQRVRYEEIFDQFEFLCGLVEFQRSNWGPVGRFLWKGRRSNTNVGQDLYETFAKRKASWPPLSQGLIEGDVDSTEKCFVGFLEHVHLVRQQYHVW